MLCQRLQLGYCCMGFASIHMVPSCDWKAMSSAPCVFVQRIPKRPSCMQSQCGLWCWCIWCWVGARLRSKAFKSGGWSSYHGRAVKTVEWILNIHFGIKRVTLWAVFFNGDLLPFFYFGKEAATSTKEKQVQKKRVKSLQSIQTLNVMARRLFPPIVNFTTLI